MRPERFGQARKLQRVEVKALQVGFERAGDDYDEDGISAPGEIWVRGDNLFAGFWPDGADGPDADGWLATGDLASPIPQGRS